MTRLTEQICRQLLLQTWGEQSCQNPANWPETLASLLKGRPHDDRDFDEHGHLKERAKYPRGSLSPWVDRATRSLTTAFASNIPDDPTDTCWRAFSKLNRQSCARLADRLINAARGN
jgi:hypothetical protein